MRKIFVLIFFTIFTKLALAQLPSTLRTNYRQLRIATQTKQGDPITNATCTIWYLDKINDGSISYTACDNIEPTTYKITSSDPSKGTASSWSKRYFGYDPKFSTTVKGVPLDDMAITIIYNNGNYSIMTVFSSVNEKTEQTESSVMMWYYNL